MVLARGFDPLVKIDGRYYGFPSTDKQNIDLNVNVTKNVNNLSRTSACSVAFGRPSANDVIAPSSQLPAVHRPARQAIAARLIGRPCGERPVQGHSRERANDRNGAGS